MFFFHLFILCSAHVSSFFILLSDSLHERIRKLETSDFERGKIIGACLAGASMTKIVTLLGVLRPTVSKVISEHTNHGMTTSVKRNSGRKSTLTKKNHRTLRRTVLKKPQNYCSTGDSRTEYVFIVKTVPTKTG
jgi:hypothetical protein